jgi:hypothetical protein
MLVLFALRAIFWISFGRSFAAFASESKAANRNDPMELVTLSRANYDSVTDKNDITLILGANP